MTSDRQRQRSRQAADAAGRRPDLSGHLVTPDPDAPRPLAADGFLEHPPIARRHPNWWQVHRLEVRHGVTDYVLIAECRTETAAIWVMTRERWQTRLTKWGHREPPLLSYHPPRVLAD